MENEKLSEYRDMVKTLFAVSAAGELEDYLRGLARFMLSECAGRKDGNLIHAEDIFYTITFLREKAEVALPDGRELAISRTEINRIHGPQKWAH